MDKIWIKKELYLENYEFMNILYFSDFYLRFKLIFLSIFPYLNHKKEFTYLQVLTWRAGLAGKLMWRAGPPRGCDAALRPRHRAAGGPHEAQEVHKAWTRGRRPRVSTRVHVGACVGRHMVGGLVGEGPTG